MDLTTLAGMDQSEIKKLGLKLADVLKAAHEGDALPWATPEALDEIKQMALDLKTTLLRPAGSAHDDDSAATMERKAAWCAMLRKGKGALSAEQKALLQPENWKGLDPEVKLALSSLSDPEGGVLVVPEFRAQLIEKLQDETMIRQKATVLQSAVPVTFPTFDYAADADWKGENDAIDVEDVTDAFGKVQFSPTKLARIFKVPDELMRNPVMDIEALMLRHFGMRFGQIHENAYLNADGVAKPLGLLAQRDGALILPTVDSTDEGDGAVMCFDNVFDVVYSVKASYRKNCAWMLNRAGIKFMRKLKTATGEYLWKDGDLTKGQPPTLAGYPVAESEWMPNKWDAGSDGDPLALFGDLSWYWIVDDPGMFIQRLVEKYAEYDQVGFKLKMKTDGAPVIRDAFAVLVRHN